MIQSHVIKISSSSHGLIFARSWCRLVAPKDDKSVQSDPMMTYDEVEDNVIVTDLIKNLCTIDEIV